MNELLNTVWRWDYLERSSRQHQPVLHYRPQTQRWEEGERGDGDDDTCQRKTKRPTFGRQGSGRGRHGFFGCQAADNGQGGDDGDEASQPDVNPDADIIEGRVGVQSGKGAAVVLHG